MEDLQPTAIASCHSPTIDRPHVARAFEMTRGLPRAIAPAQPGQPALDALVASLAASDPPVG